MELMFLIVACLPVVAFVIGLGLLIAGFALRKKKQSSRILIIVGGVCIGICLLFYAVLFLIGAFGIGPIPS